jgi:hypothetical protein
MLIALTMPLPDLAALALVVLLPIAFSCVFWRQIGVSLPVKRHKPTVSGATLLGLAGQWARHERHIATGIERQTGAVKLHRQIAIEIGALDYEIDQLWRETRALGSAADTSSITVSALHPTSYRRLPSGLAYAASRRAALASRPAALAS